PVVVNLAPMPDMDVSMEDMPEEDAKEMKEELGIDMPVVQNLQIEELNIFPNPSQGLFNLKFNLPNNEFTIIRIFDGSGKLIYTRDLGNFDGDFNAQLDLTNNPAGTYYLMVQQGELSISKKVLIVRS
ncbi:MAG: T9SS type A sorting domain-containing protein, partial [Bacteroidota bacterium]